MQLILNVVFGHVIVCFILINYNGQFKIQNHLKPLTAIVLKYFTTQMQHKAFHVMDQWRIPSPVQLFVVAHISFEKEHKQTYYVSKDN
jgi:hypothetical protein